MRYDCDWLEREERSKKDDYGKKGGGSNVNKKG